MPIRPPHYVVGKPSLTHLVSKLNIRIRPKQRQFSQPDGPTGRLKMMRTTVTALVKHERLETPWHRADEARGYAERLISEAIRYGDLHKPTMELAKFWIHDEALIPKLFKVLVPRYEKWPAGLPYTRVLKAPGCVRDHLRHYEMGIQIKHRGTAVMELRGNPYPPLPGPFVKAHPGQIQNVLLEEARKDYFRKQTDIANQAEQSTNAVPVPGEESCEPDHLPDDDTQTESDSQPRPGR